MGIKYDEFWHLSPLKLEYIGKGYKKRRLIEDENNWYLGKYFQIAVITAIDKALNGDKSQSKYFDEPILVMAEREANMTEEERINRELNEMIRAEEKWSEIARKQGLPKI